MKLSLLIVLLLCGCAGNTNTNWHTAGSGGMTPGNGVLPNCTPFCPHGTTGTTGTTGTH